MCSLLLACNNQQDHLETSAPDKASTSEEAATSDSSNNPTDFSPETPEEITSQFPKSELSDSIALDSINDTPSLRAETPAEQGTLVMVSDGREERGHLIVSSVLGVEGDQTFQSHYSVVYRKDNQDKVLLSLPNFLFIQPSDKKLSFDKISFKETDVYLLTPQYRTGHGLEGYAFAVDKKSGDAFPLKLMRKGYESKTLLYADKGQLPFSQNERLVVHPPIGAGTPEEDTKDIYYQLDLENKQLVAK
ncbi:hypothetical protein P4H66_14080 [Paenibacillus dokdonensis]|uniref:Lipoprotein n=2 Tax=Paenibacillus dokdonensis TaxID=2567944 RepID=A0ABU6GMK4_9BACL|nr:hypothetical protein [Paenibacillus dokdonensis]MEC0240977.1 hypothetical protein [Paenibacillus dokdonensis]